MNSPTEVYRHYDKNGVLLYVEISYDSDDRANQHKVNSDWYHLSVEMRVEKIRY